MIFCSPDKLNLGYSVIKATEDMDKNVRVSGKHPKLPILTFHFNLTETVSGDIITVVEYWIVGD